MTLHKFLWFYSFIFFWVSFDLFCFLIFSKALIILPSSKEEGWRTRNSQDLCLESLCLIDQHGNSFSSALLVSSLVTSSTEFARFFSFIHLSLFIFIFSFYSFRGSRIIIDNVKSFLFVYHYLLIMCIKKIICMLNCFFCLNMLKCLIFHCMTN